MAEQTNKQVEVRFLIYHLNCTQTKRYLKHVPVTGSALRKQIKMLILECSSTEQNSAGRNEENNSPKLKTVMSFQSNLSVDDNPSDTTFYMYRVQGDRQKKVNVFDEFDEDLKIVVRFGNDPRITLNRAHELEDKLKKYVSQEPDLMNLNSGNKVLVLDQQSNKEFNVLVLLSNPLITFEVHSQFQTLVTSDDRKRFITGEVLKPQKYDREPELKQHHERLWRLHKATAKVTNADESNLTYKRKFVKVIQLHCDVDTTDKEPHFLLEDEINLRVERKVKVSKILKNIDNKQLLIVVGDQASSVLETLKGLPELQLNVITIDTIAFWADAVAQTFLASLYDHVFEHKSQEITFFLFRKYFVEVMNQLKTLIEKEQHVRGLCCCLHPHEINCQFKKKAHIYGDHTMHQYFHQHDIAPTSSQTLGTRSSIGQQEVTQPNKLEIGCCCNKFSDYHAIERKIRISIALGQQETSPLTVRMIQPISIELKQLSNQRHPRLESLLKFLVVRAITRKDLQVSIEVVNGEEDDQNIRTLLTLEIENFIDEQKESSSKHQYNYVDFACKKEYINKIDELLSAKVENNFVRKGLNQEGVTNIIIVHSLPEFLTTSELIAFQDGLRSFISFQGRTSNWLRIMIITATSIRMTDTFIHHIRYSGLSIPGFLYRRLLTNIDFAMKNDSATFFEQIRSLYHLSPIANDAYVMEPNLKLTLQHLEMPWKKIESLLVSPLPELHHMGSSQSRMEDIHSGWVNLVQTVDSVKEKPDSEVQDFLKKLSSFSHGLTLNELQLSEFQGRRFKPVDEILKLRQQKSSSTVLSTLLVKEIPAEICLSPIHDDRCIFVKVAAMQEIKKFSEDDITGLEYLVRYSRYLLFDSEYPENKFQNIREESCLLESGIFFYRRTTNFQYFFDEGEVLSEEEEFSKAEFKGLQKCLNIATNKPTFKKMYAVHFRNVSDLLAKFSDCKVWDDNVFHYFCELALNAVMLQTLHEDIGWQMTNEELIIKTLALVKSNKQRLFVTHPKSINFLQLQLRLIYTYIRRGWGISTIKQLEDLDIFFNKHFEKDPEISGIWKIVYLLNQLLEEKILAAKSGNKQLYYNQIYNKFAAVSALIQNSKHRNQTNYQRLSMRLAMQVAFGVYSGMALQGQSQPIFKIDGMSPIRSLIFELNKAVGWFSKKKARILEIRALIYIQHLARIEINLESKANQKGIKYQKNLLNELTKQEGLREVKQKLQQIYFEFHTQQLSDSNTKDMMVQSITKVNNDMKQCTPYSFVYLVKEGETALCADIVLYPYQTIMRFIRFGMNNTPSSTLMKRFTKQNFEKAVNSGAQVLFLLVDDLEPLQYDRQVDLHEKGQSKEPVNCDILLKKIALSSCDIVVICGRGACKFAAAIFQAHGKMVWPTIISVDIEAPLIPSKDSNYEPEDLMQRQFVYKFLVTFCDHISNQPNEIFSRIEAIRNKILALYPGTIRSKMKVELMQSVNCNVNVARPDQRLCFDSEWSSRTNLRFVKTGVLPTLLIDSVVQLYSKTTLLHESPLKMTQVKEFVGPERRIMLLSLLRLLKYHTRLFLKGIYYWNMDEQMRKQQHKMNSKNYVEFMDKLTQQIFPKDAKEVENSTGKILFAFHFERELTEDELVNIRKTAKEILMRSDFVILSFESDSSMEGQQVCEINSGRIKLLKSCLNPRKARTKQAEVYFQSQHEVEPMSIAEMIAYISRLPPSIFPHDDEAKSELQASYSFVSKTIKMVP